MRILVTGGAGFIGSNYVRRILDGTLPGVSKIRVLDKLTYAGNLENFTPAQRKQFEFNQGDICDEKAVKQALLGMDAVVNFAAESHVDRSIEGSSVFVKTNTLGTFNLLELSRELNIENFLQVSTDEVYGSIESGSWSESEPLLPNSPYSASKASADLLCRAFSKTHGLNIKVTRCSNNYGPFQYPEKLIPLFVTNLIRDRKVPVYGTGENRRDWLHVDDHCRGIHLALVKGRAGEIYNIGGGKELSNIEITRLILSHLGRGDSEIEYVEDRKGHDFRYSVDISKIENELGYTPNVTFEAGLLNTIDWYQNNSQWWTPLISN